MSGRTCRERAHAPRVPLGSHCMLHHRRARLPSPTAHGSLRASAHQPSMRACCLPAPHVLASAEPGRSAKWPCGRQTPRQKKNETKQDVRRRSCAVHALGLADPTTGASSSRRAGGIRPREHGEHDAARAACGDAPQHRPLRHAQDAAAEHFRHAAFLQHQLDDNMLPLACRARTALTRARRDAELTRRRLARLRTDFPS